MERWSLEQAWEWYRARPPIKGFNYIPRTSVNTTELWQAETFDLALIAEELGWAGEAGYNSLRLFIQYLVWEADPWGLLERFDQVLQVASRQGLSVMPVLFDDCAFAGREPYLGPQEEPVPGVHNSQWTPSPGASRVKDTAAWAKLEQYVKAFIGAFGERSEVLAWDLYNEPGNNNQGEASLPLVEAAFDWAREASSAMQPLTVGPWWDYEGPMSQRLVALSDVVSFHCYLPAEAFEQTVKGLTRHARPLLCTELLHRQSGSTFEAVLPVCASNQIGWYQWGLVAGRTQTWLDWQSTAGDPPPEIWQHDIFDAEGNPWNPEELSLIKDFRFLD